MADYPSNDELADVLERIASLLEVDDANEFRVRAYRSGASTVRQTEQQVGRLARDADRAALLGMPGIGEGLANVLVDYAATGQSELLNRLEAESGPEKLLAEAPGIGGTLARRIVDELDIHSLEELEQAAHDGRLDEVEGFGPERVKAVKTSLAGMLSRTAQRRAEERTEPAAQQPAKSEPPVELLLAVDDEYRRRAEAGELKQIAPKRFNPAGEAWLPVLNLKRDGWSFTALYSNTARAHELEKTHDWVVLYFEREGQKESQRTVVTQAGGDLDGKRVVRGREKDTRSHYNSGHE